MKKIILVAFILAALGGALHYYLQTTKPSGTSSTAYKQTIIGEWKIDSVAAISSANATGLLAMTMDTNYSKYHFQFKEDGSITQFLGDSIVPVKRGYEWKDSTHLVFKEGDSLAEKHSVKLLTLSKEQFAFINADSSVFYFKKQSR